MMKTAAIYLPETAELQIQISEIQNQVLMLRQKLEALTKAEAIASSIMARVAEGVQELQQLQHLVGNIEMISRLEPAILRIFRGDNSDSSTNSDTPGGGGVPPKPTPKNDPSHDSTSKLTEKNGQGNPAKVAIIPALNAAHNGTKPVHHNGQKHTLPETVQLSLPFEPGSETFADSAQFTPAEHQKNTDFDYPVISVEMTPEEQDVYALMGISPLVLANQQVKNPKSAIISMTTTQEQSTSVVTHDFSQSPLDSPATSTEKAIALDNNTPSPAEKAIALDNNTPSPAEKAIALDNTPSPTEKSLVDTESEVLPMQASLPVQASSPVSALAILAYDTEENLPIGEYPLSEVVEFVTSLESWFSIDETPIPGTLYLTSERLTADTETATDDQREVSTLESKILDRFNKLAVRIENRNLITALEISGILLNQQELSAHLGVTPGTISSWKKKPNFVELSADRDPNGWGWTICPITKRCYPYSYPPANLLPELQEKLYGMCSAEAYKYYIQTKFGHEQAALTLSDWGTMATDFSNLRSQNHTTISLKAVKKFLGENDQKNSSEKLEDNKSEPSPLKNATPNPEEFPDLEDCDQISRVEFPDLEDCDQISRVEFPDLEDCDQISRVELLKRKLADLGYSEERIQDASIKTFGTRIEELNTEDLEIFESFLDEY